MNIWKRALGASIVFLVFVTAGARADNDPVSAAHQQPVSTTQQYNTDSPPDGLPVDSAEAGVTVTQFGCTALVDGEVIDQSVKDGVTTAAVRVDSVRITLSLRVDEWIAAPPSRGIVDHEDGHRIISEHFYAHADVVAEAIGRKIIGHVISASGADESAAARNAMGIAAAEINRRYVQQVRDTCQKAQDAYDQITAHGTNDVDEMDAINWALKKVGKS